MQGGAEVNEMSMTISYKFMNNNLRDCFNDCANDFRSGELSSSEVTCIKNCGQRSFAALNLLQTMQQMQGGQGGQGGRGF